jgi:uncharacterized RDD family membrane protein YckC
MNDEALAATMPMSAPPPSVDKWIGKRVDHFQIESLLGRGGMGAVYLAHDTSLDRMVAIKMIPDELAGQAELEERFVREARAQAKLSSPNVVQIYYVGHAAYGDKRVLYFAMERIPGESLEAVLDRDDKLEPEDARKLMIEAARGLRDARAAGIVHRDVKPSNLLRCPSGLKIADFGLAKPTRDVGQNSITKKGAMLGTPLYISPEQAQGETVEFSTDMYSLGCTFFHLLTGSPPYEGNGAILILAAHLNAPVASVLAKAPLVPHRLAAIVERLMAKKPADRYASYDELIAVLEAAAPDAVEYAGFWTRAAASLVNLGIAAILVALLGWAGVVVHLLHITIGHAYWGASVGKYLMRIRVLRSNGQLLGLRRSIVRTILSLWQPLGSGAFLFATRGKENLLKIVETMQPSAYNEFKQIAIAFAFTHAYTTSLYALGLVIAALPPQKQALHDLLVRTVVVYRRG